MARVRGRTRASGELEEPLLQPNGANHDGAYAGPALGPTTMRPRTMPPRTAGHGRWSSCWFEWVTPLMRTGASRQLQAEDLLRLDPGLQPELCGRQLWMSWSKELLVRPERPSLLRALARTYGRPYAWLGLIKLLNDLLSFTGPLLLKLLVTWLAAAPPPATPSAAVTHGSVWPDPDPGPAGGAASAAGATASAMAAGAAGGGGGAGDGGGGAGGVDPWVWWRVLAAALGPSSPRFGAVCVVLLGLTSVVRALLNAHFNYQLSRLSCQLRAGIMCVLYRKSLLAVRYDSTAATPSGAAGGGGGGGADVGAAGGGDEDGRGGGAATAAAAAAGGGGSDVSTLMSVDSGRAVNLLLSFHELWSLPMQMVLALYLLYTQVRYAFLAGLAVSLLLVPINRLIAGRILAASRTMMAAKDARVSAMLELLRGIAAVKTAPQWEGFYVAKVSSARRRELRGLAVRKYLDALCVYFWAATSLLFSALTFGLLVALGGGATLSPGVAFTSLALFNLLTGPLNAFPWVVNGVVEAVVSVRRLQGYLYRSETKALWAYEDLELHLRDLPPKAAAALLAAAAGGGGGSGGLVAALREAGAAATAATASPAGGGGGARPIDRLLRTLRLPPAAAAALTWQSRARASRQRRLSAAGAPEAAAAAPAAAAGGADCAAGGSGAVVATADAASVIVHLAGAGASPEEEDPSQPLQAPPPPPPPAPPPPLTPPPPPPQQQPHPSGVAAVLQSATFAWEPAARPCLYDISLVVPRGGLTVVVGRVGAGKSSLLAALLGGGAGGVGGGGGAGGGGGGGELPLLRGTYRTHVRRLSYAPQQPWVMAGSLRDNVLLGAAMDERLYGQVLHDCALLPDLEAMPAGDLTAVGDNGCKLSGGQRARLGLARALYHAAKSGAGGGAPAPASASASAGPSSATATTTAQSAAAAAAATASSPAALAFAAAGLTGRDPESGPDPGCRRRRRLPRPDLIPSPVPDLDLDPDPDPDVLVLLDDVLASLDRSCASHVVQHALLGRLLRPPGGQQPAAAAAGLAVATAPGGGGGGAPPTVVLVSNDGRCIAAASLVVALEAGRVAYAGDPQGYLTSQHCLHSRDHALPHQHQRHQHPLDFHQQRQQQQQPRQGGSGGDDGDPAHREGTRRAEAGGAAPAPAAAAAASAQLDAVACDDYSGDGNGDDGDGEGGGGGGRAAGGGSGDSSGASGSGEEGGAAAAVGGAAAEEEEEEEEEEEREVGHVRWRVYGRYGRAVGRRVVAAVLLSLALMQASRNANDLWVSYFAAHSGGGGGSTAAAAAPATPPPTAAAFPLTAGCGGAGSVVLGSGGNRSLPRPLLRSCGPMGTWPGAGVWALQRCSGVVSAGWPHPAAGLGTGASRAAAGAVVAAAGWPAGWPGAAMCPLLTLAPEPAPPPVAYDAVAAAGPGHDRFSVGGGGGDGGGVWSTRNFLVGVVAIAAANSVFTMARAFSFALAGMRAAALLHDQLLRAVLSAPLSFFHSVPHGRILNRFSSDVSTVDDSLPFILNIALANAASLAGLLAVLCFAAPPLLPLLLPLAVVYRRLQVFYRGSSREVRRLEALALAPVYGAFGGVAEAAPLVRAFGAQPYFLGTAVAAVTRHQRAAITGGAASAWLGLRLQLLASGLVAAVAGLAVWRSHRHHSSGGDDDDSPSYGLGGGTGGGGGGDLVASLAGLSLAYALPVVGLLNGLLTSTAETEQEMVSVERLSQYIDDVSPQPLTLPPLPPPPPAPEAAAPNGASGAAIAAADAAAAAAAVVAVESLVVRYRPGLPAALCGLSLAVAAGQHVGLCGRTGAGKSSVVAALLRLVEAESGRVLLYGVDVRSVPLPRLRASVGVLLQRPFLASATVRENLDPLAATAKASAGGRGAGGGDGDGCGGGHSDAALCHALRCVGLWDALALAAIHRRSGGAATASAATDGGPGGAGSSTGRRGARAAGKPPRQPAAAKGAAATSSSEVLSLPLGSLPGAVGLSAGQQQLLCLARLLLRPRRLVLLDECASHVDPATATAIRRLVSELILKRPLPAPLSLPPLQRGGGNEAGQQQALSAIATEPWIAGGINGGGGGGSVDGAEAKKAAGVATVAAAAEAARVGKDGEGDWREEDEVAAAAEGATLRWPPPGPPAVLEVAHDLAAIAGCDRVVVMEAGRAVEEGPPAELAARQGGRFRALYLASASAAATAAAPEAAASAAASSRDALS